MLRAAPKKNFPGQLRLSADILARFCFVFFPCCFFPELAIQLAFSPSLPCKYVLGNIYTHEKKKRPRGREKDKTFVDTTEACRELSLSLSAGDLRILDLEAAHREGAGQGDSRPLPPWGTPRLWHGWAPLASED